MSKEIVIIMGIQGAGKSTIVQEYVDKGYTRANRDEEGGSLTKLNMQVEGLMSKGVTKFVMDNTYGTKMSRFEVLELAKRRGFTVKCVWLSTKIEDAQFNVCTRIYKNIVAKKMNMCTLPMTINEVYGPNGAKMFPDPSNVPSIALYAYKKNFEAPTMAEGFSSVEEVKFVRKPLPAEYKNKAILLDYDGTLRKTKSGDKFPVSPDDIEILPGRVEKLKKMQAAGYKLFGVSNQSGIEKGDLSKEIAMKCFDRTNQLLGITLDMPVLFCPHHSFPIRCYCRKPLPGLGVFLIHAFLLNPKECVMVGDSTSDKTFSTRCGFGYEDEADFFKG